MSVDMTQAAAAAETALAAMALRAMLLREAAGDPNIASLTVHVALDAEGLPAVDLEFFNRAGHPAWGFAL